MSNTRNLCAILLALSAVVFVVLAGWVAYAGSNYEGPLLAAALCTYGVFRLGVGSGDLFFDSDKPAHDDSPLADITTAEVKEAMRYVAPGGDLDIVDMPDRLAEKLAPEGTKDKRVWLQRNSQHIYEQLIKRDDA